MFAIEKSRPGQLLEPLKRADAVFFFYLLPAQAGPIPKIHFAESRDRLRLQFASSEEGCRCELCATHWADVDLVITHPAQVIRQLRGLLRAFVR